MLPSDHSQTNICYSLLSDSSLDERHHLWSESRLIYKHRIVRLIFNEMKLNWSNWQSWGLSFWKPDWEFPLVRPRSWWCLELCRKFSSSWPDRSEMWSNNTIFNINRNHETITRIQMMEIGKVSFQKLYWIETRNFGEKKTNFVRFFRVFLVRWGLANIKHGLIIQMVQFTRKMSSSTLYKLW